MKSPAPSRDDVPLVRPETHALEGPSTTGSHQSDSGRLDSSHASSSGDSGASLTLTPNLGVLEDCNPRCFDREVFLREGDFDVQAFLAQCRARVPLESVQADLEACANSLETQLVCLINEDYADFVRLSSNLVGVDASLSALRTHLQGMLQEVQAVRRAVEQSTQDIQQQLFLRRTLRERRHYLSLFLTLHEKIARMETHLGIAPQPATATSSASLTAATSSMNSQSSQSSVSSVSSSSTTPLAAVTATVSPPRSQSAFQASSSLSASSAAALSLQQPLNRVNGKNSSSSEDQSQLEALLVERVSADYAYVRCRMRQLESTPFVRALSTRVERIERTLDSTLERAFLAALRLRREELLISCLRTYATIDRFRHAEELYRRSVISPVLSKFVTTEVLEHGVRGSCEGLQSIFDSVHRLLAGECRQLLQAATLEEQYNFLARAIWAELSSLLISRVPVIFSAAFPERFLQNYRVVLNALRETESNCYSIHQLMQFRNSSVVSDLLSRFPLPVYFSMCFRKITAPLAPLLEQSSATALQTDAFSKPKSADSPFRLALTESTLQALHRCWAPESFVVAIADRFVRLSVQIAVRFQKWADSVSSVLTDRSLSEQPPSGKRRPIWESPLPVLLIIADLQALQHNIVATTLIPQAWRVDLSEEMLRSTQSAYDLVHKELHSTVSVILERIADELSAECRARLQPVHTIAQTYRMAYRPDPTMPSYYVSTVLQPLKEFLRVARDSGTLASASQLATVLLVVEPVSRHFADAQDKLWADFEQQSSLLAKMTRHRTNAPVLATSSSSSKTLSDEDQIAAQLTLDVNYYLDELRNLLPDHSLDVDAIASSQELLKRLRQRTVTLPTTQ